MIKISYEKFLKISGHVFIWGLLYLFFVWILNYRFIFLNKSAGDAQLTVHRIFGYSQVLVSLTLLATIFYLNYYLLIPRYLSQKKFVKYAAALATILVLAYGISYYNRPNPPDFAKLRQSLPDENMDSNRGFVNRFEGREPPKRPFFFNFGDLLLSMVALTVSTSIRGTREWFANERQLKDIENKKLITELSYLKAQINPHFFFNTLNGIYALARQKSDRTPDVILKLSELMRYIIYEANTSKVLLSREIEHIENYIELQKMRLDEMVKVTFEVNGNPGILQIEPLLFSVFLENAFKHGIDYSRPGTIEVKLSVLNEGLVFVVKNPVSQAKKTKMQAGNGIGLNNIRQRLNLVYPGRHQLKIYQLNDEHIVELYLNIEHDEVHNH